jgi:hypothetical protein
MDRNTFLGDTPLKVLVRLAVLSLVVGVILSVLDITPQNLFQRIRDLLQAIYDLGFDAFEKVLSYLIVGAMVVVPIWLIARLLKTTRRPDPKP